MSPKVYSWSFWKVSKFIT